MFVNGDCIEVMANIPDGEIDLIVSDPPYLMNYQSNRRKKEERFDKILNDKDNKLLISEYLKECSRILKKDAAIYIFCSWHNVDFFKQEFEKYFKLKNIIVWNKNNHGSGDLKGAYSPKHEFVLFGHKGRALFKNKRVPDVIDFPKVNSNKLRHPTEKPIGLLEMFILNNSDVGEVVFDGFAGIGTTAMAASNNKRKYFCVELDKQYYEIAKELGL